MKDLRTLCDEAVQFWDADCDMDGVISEMRAHLTQPVQPGLTDEALLAIAAASIDPYQDSGIAIGEYEPETEHAVEVYGSELIAFARAVLARWGRPAIEPEPEGPTDEEWQEFLDQCGRAQAIAEREGYEFPYWVDDKAEEFKARWGRSPQ